MERNLVFRGKTVNDVWEKGYKALARQAAAGVRQGSRDGDVVGEILNATFVVEDPTRMIVSSDIRKMPMRYAVGELMWYLSGSNKTSDISQFSSVWNNLSDDGEHANSSYGYRIHSKFGIDQWEAVKEMLKKDPLSRQAIIHIKAPEDNVVLTPTKDLPCTLSLQFFIRDELVKVDGDKGLYEPKLHLTVHMRSNDIWTGTPYDMFSFCCMQVKMAMELGVGVGTYTHTAGSLHLYERNYKEIDTSINTYDEMVDKTLQDVENLIKREGTYMFDENGEPLPFSVILDELKEAVTNNVELWDGCTRAARRVDTHDSKDACEIDEFDDYANIKKPEFKISWEDLQEQLGKVIAVDFDGCLCKDKYPLIGSPNLPLIKELIKIRKKGGKVILNTCRSGELLDKAVEFCEMYDLEFDAVNTNLPEIIEYFGYDTRKIWATEYWDDKAVKVEKR